MWWCPTAPNPERGCQMRKARTRTVYLDLAYLGDPSLFSCSVYWPHEMKIKGAIYHGSLTPRLSSRPLPSYSRVTCLGSYIWCGAAA